MEKTGSLPQVNSIGFSDLVEVLKQGIQDFLKAPKFGLFFGFIYALGGNLMLTVLFYYNMLWMTYPMLIGFALIGPFIATGLYEVSRNLENGEQPQWKPVLGIIWEQRRRELGWMAFVMLFIFWIWSYQVRTLVAVFFGSAGFASFDGFLHALFTTSNGLTFLLVGHVVGAIVSLVLFSITVISCPMLLDRDVDFVTAMITSVRSVLASPVVILVWGCFVVVTVLVSAIPFFVGLLVTLPVLGHSTWHLYRKAIP